MKQFANLFRELDGSNRTSLKVKAMKQYFASVDSKDAAWAVYFLSGNRLKRSIQLKELRRWVAEDCGYPEWMVEECYDHVGDLAETLSLLLAQRLELQDTSAEVSLTELVEHSLLPLKNLEPAAQRERLGELLNCLDETSCFILIKLITGGFRVGVSKTLVTRALAELAGVEAGVMAHRLMGTFEPSADAYRELFCSEIRGDKAAQPYPFCLAYPMEEERSLEDLFGAVQDWQIEWKWDGIRAQLIKRGDLVMLWSRGEEVLCEQFPEIIDAAASLRNDVVLDGEILAWDFETNSVASFATLQKRLGRKSAGPKIRKEVPIVFMAYDCLESERQDLRSAGLCDRRRRLEALCDSFDDVALRCSPRLKASSWQEVARIRDLSREQRVEGLMLKRLDSTYVAGRKKGHWWKWKVDPYTVDAVLVYAQQGHGRRAGLYSDYTFSIWKNGELVPFAKAYSGLSDAELRQVDRWIRAHTTDKHGPVRVVDPQLVFEIAFEGITVSKRHKSGIAVRFPRIHRWRRDKLAAEADSLDTILGLL